MGTNYDGLSARRMAIVGKTYGKVYGKLRASLLEAAAPAASLHPRCWRDVVSYDLNFWRYVDEDVPRSDEDHLAVYNALCDGREPEGLMPLPWPGLRKRIEIHFHSWARDGDVWTKKGVVVEMSGSQGWVRFDLRGPWTGDQANPLIDIMKTYRCPLFDPQAGAQGVRFELTA